MAIHPDARVSEDCEMGSGVTVAPFAVVEPGVVIGDGCSVAAHAVLKTGLRLGAGVRVFEGAVLGGEPQDLKFAGGESFVTIGDGSVIREFATVHRSAQPGGETRVGKHCLLMAYGHVAHDCLIGERVVIASYAALAGHIEIGDRAFVSGGVVIHQFSKIGELAMIGGGSKINLDVPPFLTVDGSPGRAVGLNQLGLRRAGVAEEDISALKQAYRILYRSRLSQSEALEAMESIDCDTTRKLCRFVRESERGICPDRWTRRH